MTQIGIAVTVDDLARCYPVMHELRPHLDRRAFVDQVRRQMQTAGYQLAWLEHDGYVAALAGFRFVEMLAWGKVLYVDDLVTTEALRGRGLGGRLFDWLIEQARMAQCAGLHLDSGVQRFEAHRFYLNKRMNINSYHFSMKVDDGVARGPFLSAP